MIVPLLTRTQPNHCLRNGHGKPHPHRFACYCPFRTRLAFRFLQLLLSCSAATFALDAGDFDEVNGYTVMDVTYVDGDFEGADFNRPVVLGNGMIFRFTAYSYSYAYQPDVVVFARHYSPEELKRIGIVNPSPQGFTTYKLLTDDEFYDANRVRWKA